MDAKDKLKQIRKDNFQDGSALKNKIAEDPKYAGVEDIRKKGKAMLDKVNGRT